MDALVICVLTDVMSWGLAALLWGRVQGCFLEGNLIGGIGISCS